MYNPESGLADLSALAAELIGDDQLAAYYAVKGLDLYPLKPAPLASCRATLGRIAQRRGDATAAESHFRSACEGLLAAKAPILVLRIAEDWGAEKEEPQRLVSEACAIMGRPVEKVRREFREATTSNAEASRTAEEDIITKAA